MESLQEYNFYENVDLFSLDIDGIDYWILKKLPKKFCKILVAEYNPYFGDKLKISAIEKSKFLVIAGKPINEPIVRGGPFVMNTKQEILKAVQDYHSGNFAQK